mgnify:FL=1
MANLCENVLRISGAHKDIISFDERFRGGKDMKDEYYSFENLYPAPELSISDKCDWCKKHWSVKGDFYEENFAKDTIRDDDMETYYYFDTAWRGPELLIQHISKEFDLEFMLVSSEPGSNIRRLVVFNNGIMTSEEELNDEEVAYWFGEAEAESA